MIPPSEGMSEALNITALSEDVAINAGRRESVEVDVITMSSPSTVNLLPLTIFSAASEYESQRFMEATASDTVNGDPSWNRTPFLILNRKVHPSSSDEYDSARSGTISPSS